MGMIDSQPKVKVVEYHYQPNGTALKKTYKQNAAEYYQQNTFGHQTSHIQASSQMGVNPGVNSGSKQFQEVSRHVPTSSIYTSPTNRFTGAQTSNLRSMQSQISSSPQQQARKEYQQQLAYEKQLKVRVDQFHKKLGEAKQYGRKMKDPKKFKELKAQHFQNFLQGIRKMNLNSQLDKTKKKRCFLGSISTGKSSLINMLIGCQLPVGCGETTTQPTRISITSDMEIWDTPGENEDFNVTKLEVLKVICQCDRIFILYDSSLKRVDSMIKVIAAAKPGCAFLIRTKCDAFSQKVQKSLEEELAEDHKVLKSWGIEPQSMPIYCTCALSENAFDNKTVKNILLTNIIEPSKYVHKFPSQNPEKSIKQQMKINSSKMDVESEQHIQKPIKSEKPIEKIEERPPAYNNESDDQV